MSEEAILLSGKNTVLLKRAIAVNLYNGGVDQSKISEILEISQPMVSNYCSSKTAIPENINDMARKISKKILNGLKPRFYTSILFSDVLDEGIYFIGDRNEIITDENKNISDNLMEAYFSLKDVNIDDLVPEVKINIAMAKENAKSSDDVAAFLNGLIVVDGKISSNNGVRFGKSRHLSSLLIYLQKNLDINAIMNIAYISDYEKYNLKFDFLTKDFKIKSKEKNIDVLLHKGDFGIEPCAYIVGKNATDISKKLIKLRDETKK